MIRINSNALTKLWSENLWKLRTAISNRLTRLQLIICRKKELLSSLSCMKLVLIRNKCYQCKLFCTGMMNKWCKILIVMGTAALFTSGATFSVAVAAAPLLFFVTSNKRQRCCFFSRKSGSASALFFQQIFCRCRYC